MSETNWIELKFLSKFVTCDQLLAINDNEFIIIPYFDRWRQKNIDNCANGIYKFNTINNQWIKMMHYSKDFESTFHGTTFDNKNKLIFIYNSQSQLIEINLNTQSFKILSTSVHNFNTFLSPKIININDNIHIIADNAGHSEHFIFDKKTNQLNEMYQFDFQHKLTQNLLHLKSRNSIFFAGETCFYEYSILNKKWKQLNIVIPSRLSYSAVVCTKNEQFLIFLGGLIDNCDHSDNISIYDFKTKKLTQSVVKLPNKETFIAVMMNN
eukprot:216183_1